MRTRNILIVLLWLLVPTMTFAQTERVLILPFEINAAADLGYLQTEIPSVLGRHLEADGAEILALEPAEADSAIKAGPDAESLRQLGIRQGADHVVRGSLTMIDGQYSIDVRLIKTLERGLAQSFFAAGQGIENLPRTVKDVSRDLAIRIFRREKVASVEVAGNQRIETDAIMEKIKTATGDVFLTKSISEDLKRVYAMGYFDDIRIESRDSPAGKVVIFNVKEKPTIRNLKLEGNKVYDDDEIAEVLDIRTGSILNIFQIRKNADLIKNMYKEKNYHNVQVSYEVETVENNQGDLTYQIEEGNKVRIKEIAFEGNEAFSDKKLRGVMKTSEKGFFSWLTSSGELKSEDLDQDVIKLTSFYQNNGFMQARIADPQVRYEGDWIYIDMKVYEGPRFNVGQIDVSGDLEYTDKELREKLKVTTGKVFNRQLIRSDVLTLSDMYSDKGYAYAKVNPKLDQDEADQVVNINYQIRKGPPVFFERIIISGNTRTRDKVIRREMTVHEGELFSGQQLKRSIRNLYRLDYFEDVKVETIKGSGDDKMVLKVDVKEKSTGMFSFGGGYSSIENFFVTGSVTERNLFGRGHKLQFKADFGGATQRYTLSFTEPWLFDMPLSAGFDLYKWDRDYDDYTKESTGGAIRFGYPVFTDTRIFLKYNYDVADVTDIADDAAQTIKELEGTNVTSSLSAMIRYDTRNRVFNPTEGQDHSFTVEYAGLGGDIGFIKYVAEAGIYFPLVWELVGFLHGRGGLVEETGSGILPDYERFYLGGINSLRGFDWRDIHAVDEDGAEIGGESFVQFNAEITFPLLKDIGIVGVVFYDTGDVFGTDEDVNFDNLRQTAGYGIRWYSPMGPLRLEYGHILDREEGESPGRWEFAIGTGF